MILIVGAGAAGLMAAITAAEEGAKRVVLLESRKTPGAKILVSGGGRCNVTNEIVTERDFFGGSPRIVSRVLRRFPAENARRFFESTGVELKREEDGKLFPVSDRAKDILTALVSRASRAGVELLGQQRVVDIATDGETLAVLTESNRFTASRVILATGGLSLPKSGSDGFGLRLAERLGHTLVPTTPALAPLLLSGSFHPPLSGVSLDAEILVRRDGKGIFRRRGALLFTHFGLSGPIALDASRHLARARLEQASTAAELNLLPDFSFESLERLLIEAATKSPSRFVRTLLEERLPGRLGGALLEDAGLPGDQRLGALARGDRRRLVHAIVARPLPIVGDRGFDVAEATAGGVDLREVDSNTMESRRVPRLHFAGEMLDVDGRLGGFNFQWAWSSGFVAGLSAARSDSRRVLD